MLGTLEEHAESVPFIVVERSVMAKKEKRHKGKIRWLIRGVGACNRPCMQLWQLAARACCDASNPQAFRLTATAFGLELLRDRLPMRMPLWLPDPDVTTSAAADPRRTVEAPQKRRASLYGVVELEVSGQQNVQSGLATD
jgi:hypothetical protein